MARFSMTIALRGNNGKVSRQTFDMGNFTTGTNGGDFDAALSAANQIAGAYQDVTLAEIAAVSVSHSMPAFESGAMPGAGVDVHEFATVTCHLNAPGATEKLTNVKIVAPVEGIFIGAEGVDYDTIDRADADLVQFIQQLAQHAFVSDNEQINTTSGVNGMKAGRRNARSYSL
jgi:hypothetical protein